VLIQQPEGPITAQHSVTKNNKQDTRETNTNKTNKGILQEFIRKPYDMELIISNLTVIIFHLRVSKALQTELAAVAYLAEGQCLKDGLT
jgi:hypothetical protein